jgi:uncharacterized membrane protein YfcA
MYESFLALSLLGIAAFAAGVINTLAGGGTLLTFPSLLSLMPGLEEIANATSTVALVPGSMSGAWGFRRELRGTGPWLTLLVGPSLLGGLVGAVLLFHLPSGTFKLLIPWLLLTASLLFMAQPTMARWLKAHETIGMPTLAWCVSVVVFQFFVAVYGGYFGAGIGILMLSSLGFMGLGDIHRMNAVKTFLAACINGVAVVVFVYEGKVRWDYALLMAVCAIAGGYAGSSVGRRLPRQLVRWFVIAVGLGLAAYYFAKQAGYAGRQA